MEIGGRRKGRQGKGRERGGREARRERIGWLDNTTGKGGEKVNRERREKGGRKGISGKYNTRASEEKRRKVEERQGEKN